MKFPFEGEVDDLHALEKPVRVVSQSIVELSLNPHMEFCSNFNLIV